MTKKIIVSENNKSSKYSFKDFKLSKNFKSSLKNSAYVLIPALLTDLATNNLISAGVAALLGQMFCKAVEFYSKQYD